MSNIKNSKLKLDFQPKLAHKIKEEMTEDYPEDNSEHDSELNYGMNLRTSNSTIGLKNKKEIRKLKNENQELKKNKLEMEHKYNYQLEVNQSFISSLNAKVKELETELKNANKELDSERDKNENLRAEIRSLKSNDGKKAKTMEKIISDLKAELDYSNAMFEKEKNILLKTINELKMKTNNQTKIIIPENTRPRRIIKKNLPDSQMISSINSVDFSDLCETVSMSSSTLDNFDEQPKLDPFTRDNSTKTLSSVSNRTVTKRKHDIFEFRGSSDEKSEDTDFESESKSYQRAVQKLDFNCKIQFLLSQSLWASFNSKITSFNKSVSSYSFLKKRDMTQKQRAETDRLDKFMETLIIQNFDNMTRTKSIAKTPLGYSVRRYCATRGCTIAWTLNIDIKTGTGSIFSTKKCRHTLSSKQKNKLLRLSNEKSASLTDLHRGTDEEND